MEFREKISSPKKLKFTAVLCLKLTKVRKRKVLFERMEEVLPSLTFVIKFKI